MKFKLLFLLVVVLAGTIGLMSYKIINQNNAINDIQEQLIVIEDRLQVVYEYEYRAKLNAEVSKE